MIHLGLNSAEKAAAVSRHCAAGGVRKVVHISPQRFMQPTSSMLSDALAGSGIAFESIELKNTIQYVYYYRLLQEVTRETLIVIDECLFTQNRHDLTYNCIRNFLNQTEQQLVFQHFPLIDTCDDFMILFDLDTRSRWKRSPFSAELLKHARIEDRTRAPSFFALESKADEKTRQLYQREKRKLIDSVGLSDPHTIPRNLYLTTGRTKLGAAEGRNLVGRNGRLRLERLVTYDEDAYSETYTVFELPHRFVEFAGFATLSRQTRFEVLTTDLPVDGWYFNRFSEWSARINETCSILRSQ